eukprot:7451943-Karenia_brevis.AAC.1
MCIRDRRACSLLYPARFMQLGCAFNAGRLRWGAQVKRTEWVGRKNSRAHGKDVVERLSVNGN